MDDPTQKDIRSLLKTFGIQADEAINAHLWPEAYQTVTRAN